MEYLFSFFIENIHAIKSFVKNQNAIPKKYSIAFLLFILLANSFKSHAQRIETDYKNQWRDGTSFDERKRNAIKTNMVSYLIGDLNITYERLAQNAPRSFVIKLDFIFNSTNDFDVSGKTIRIGSRYYLSKKRLAPAGYYAEPFFMYGEYTIHDNYQQIGAHETEIGGGIIGGKQWAIGKRFTVEVFLGSAYVNIEASNYNVQSAIKSFQIIFGASTGFRF